MITGNAREKERHTHTKKNRLDSDCILQLFCVNGKQWAGSISRLLLSIISNYRRNNNGLYRASDARQAVRAIGFKLVAYNINANTQVQVDDYDENDRNAGCRWNCICWELDWDCYFLINRWTNRDDICKSFEKLLVLFMKVFIRHFYFCALLAANHGEFSQNNEYAIKFMVISSSLEWPSKGQQTGTGETD